MDKLKRLRLGAVVKGPDGWPTVKDLGVCQEVQGGGFGVVLPEEAVMIVEQKSALKLAGDLRAWAKVGGVEADEGVARVEALLTELRAKAYARWGSCATGLTDYQHRHASASNCSACGERSEAERMVKKIEAALGLKASDIPCYLTPEGSWCIPHHKAAGKCK
jgi:hypothetical protein